ncbi:MAG: ABC transporter substrate-binding protein, partial [Promethearchaeota archaeon]
MINLTKSHISRKLFPIALIFCLALTSILGLQTTGDRNTPSGVEPSPFFNVTLLVPANNPIRIDWVDLIAEKLELIGIGITAIDVAPWADAMARTVEHPGPYPIPTYDFGGYDIFFVGWVQETIEWLQVEDLFSSAKFVPNGYNYYQYSSATFDYELLNIDCTGWAHQQYIRRLQEILFEDLPSIPVVYPRDVYAMLCTVLPVGLCLWHNAFQPMDMWKKLGDTSFVYARPGYFNTTSICHPYLAESVADRQWLSQIYDSLLYPLNCTYPTWERRIAISHSHDNCTVWTVDIDPNAKWADGTPVTSDDVVFSYEAMMEPTLNSPYATLLDEHLDSVSAIDAYTVEFVLKEAYAFGELLLSYPLIPKHIWESVDYEDWETQAYTWATTDPSKIIGCGPFKLQQADDPSDTVILEKNTYFRDLLNYDEPNFETITFVRYADKAAALSALSIGEVDIVDARFDLELSELDIPGISYSIVPTRTVQELGVNMDHPYLGT